MKTNKNLVMLCCVLSILLVFTIIESKRAQKEAAAKIQILINTAMEWKNVAAEWEEASNRFEDQTKERDKLIDQLTVDVKRSIKIIEGFETNAKLAISIAKECSSTKFSSQ
jgi:hypothetical protein